MTFSNATQAVIEMAHHAGARNWIPATSGNFSARIDSSSCALTASGGDKARLTDAGVIKSALTGEKHPRASAEAPLHLMLYRKFPEIGAVAHVHAMPAVLASLSLNQDGRVTLEGLEMLKAFQGITTHETKMEIPVFPNSQDMDELSSLAEPRIKTWNQTYGLLLAGHGLYAWGRTATETIRHLDAFDYLFALSLKLKGIPV